MNFITVYILQDLYSQ